MASSIRFKSALPALLVLSLAACGGSSTGAQDSPSGHDAQEIDNTDTAAGDVALDQGSTDADDDTTALDEQVDSALAMAAPLSPVMRSGFEAGTQGMPIEAITHLLGVDNSVSVPNNWTVLLAESAERDVGYFEIQYQGGDTTDRYARLGPDPDNAGNQTLQFWLHDENIDNSTEGYRDTRGRVQANMYNNRSLSNYYQSVRLRLGADFAALIDHQGTFNWLTLFEAWNGANWIADEQFPFHIALNLSKPNAAAGSPLHFLAHGRSYVFGVGFEEHWSDNNTDFVVPLETWITLELYMRQGDADNGRFYMTAQADGEQKVVLFDIADTTHNPNDPAPNGFDYINPIKLYTLEPVLDIVNASGGSMSVHWDDLEFGYTAK